MKRCVELVVIFADYTKEDLKMTLDDILELEAKHEKQKLEQKLEDARRKNKTNTMRPRRPRKKPEIRFRALPTALKSLSPNSNSKLLSKDY